MRAPWQEWGSITEVVNLRRATDGNAMNEIGVEKGKRLIVCFGLSLDATASRFQISLRTS
jgi:hypothetical protein